MNSTDIYRTIKERDLIDYMEQIESDSNFVSTFLLNIKNNSSFDLKELEKCLAKLDDIVSLSRGIKNNDITEILSGTCFR